MWRPLFERSELAGGSPRRISEKVEPRNGIAKQQQAPRAANEFCRTWVKQITTDLAFILILKAKPHAHANHIFASLLTLEVTRRLAMSTDCRPAPK